MASDTICTVSQLSPLIRTEINSLWQGHAWDVRRQHLRHVWPSAGNGRAAARQSPCCFTCRDNELSRYHVKLIMPAGRTSLGDDELEMLVLLRINKKFMMHMKKRTILKLGCLTSSYKTSLLPLHQPTSADNHRLALVLVNRNASAILILVNP